MAKVCQGSFYTGQNVRGLVHDWSACLTRYIINPILWIIISLSESLAYCANIDWSSYQSSLLIHLILLTSLIQLIFITVFVICYLDIVDCLDSVTHFIHSWTIYDTGIYILAEHSLAHFLYYLIPFQLAEDVRLGSQI
jgi:hypothetical protein